jgi:predicted negative regulator of RcsB-dependent stress response
LTESNNRITDGIFMFANRNVLFLIIGALIVAVGVLGYNLYQDRKQPEGLQINVGPNGLKIQGK